MAVIGLTVTVAVAGPGPVQAQPDQEERELAPFSGLHVQNGIDVYLTRSGRQSLRIEADGVSLEDVVTEVEDRELRLSRPGWTSGGFLRNNYVKAYIDFEQLTYIRASGGSDLEGRNTLELESLNITASGGSDVDLDVDAQQLDFSVSGGSDVRVRGSTDSLAVRASGGSDLAARRLQAGRASLRLSGGSDAVVHVNDEIHLEASGGSDVTVHGDPAARDVDTDRSSDVDWR